MNERERWTVYPLLFLALGAALRDKIFDQTTTRRIVCQELIVVDEQPLGREPVWLARIGRVPVSTSGAPPTGYLVVNGQVEVEGPVIARQFGTPAGPVAILPTASAADLFQAVQEKLQAAMQEANRAAEKPAEAQSEPAPDPPPADPRPAAEPPAAENSPQSEPSQ
jgi:hypothetical protein